MLGSNISKDYILTMTVTADTKWCMHCAAHFNSSSWYCTMLRNCGQWLIIAVCSVEPIMPDLNSWLFSRLVMRIQWTKLISTETFEGKCIFLYLLIITGDTSVAWYKSSGMCPIIDEVFKDHKFRYFSGYFLGGSLMWPQRHSSLISVAVPRT